MALSRVAASLLLATPPPLSLLPRGDVPTYSPRSPRTWYTRLLLFGLHPYSHREEFCSGSSSGNSFGLFQYCSGTPCTKPHLNTGLLLHVHIHTTFHPLSDQGLLPVYVHTAMPCSICRQSGHNIRTCAAAKLAHSDLSDKAKGEVADWVAEHILEEGVMEAIELCTDFVIPGLGLAIKCGRYGWKAVRS